MEEGRGPLAFSVNNFYNRWWKSSQISVNICRKYFTLHCFQIDSFKSLSWPNHSPRWWGLLPEKELCLGRNQSRNRSKTVKGLKYVAGTKKQPECDLCFTFPLNGQIWSDEHRHHSESGLEGGFSFRTFPSLFPPWLLTFFQNNVQTAESITI